MMSRLEMIRNFDEGGSHDVDKGRHDTKPKASSIITNNGVAIMSSSPMKRKASGTAARITQSMSDVPTTGMTTWLRGNIELPPLLSQMIPMGEKEKIARLDHIALEKKSHHAMAELLLSISEVNRRKDDREQELLLQLSQSAKEMASLKDAHAVEVAVLKATHTVELANAREHILDAYMKSPEFVADREAYIDTHLSEISQRWLSTPEGREKLVREGYLSYKIGKYAAQQKIYHILKDKAGTSCIIDWGLPPEMPNPEKLVAKPSTEDVAFDKLPTNEELGDAPSKEDKRNP
ncbi:unnamed protein product [Cuscuta epithymum]|uniref:Uncharacterized protein n=1 Tax=Cuscuta epithymum TaxID=186058 RepID=A0AAV0GFH5_9ASTE|nr:unnamed protein product [Cuscuta epithymum]